MSIHGFDIKNHRSTSPK